MRIKRYLGLFLVALVSVFALGLANKDVKANSKEIVITAKSKYEAEHNVQIEKGSINEHLIFENNNNVIDIEYNADGRLNNIFNNGSGQIRLYSGSITIKVLESNEYLISKVEMLNNPADLSIDDVSGNSAIFEEPKQQTTIVHTASSGRSDIQSIKITIVEVSSNINASVKQLISPENEISIPDIAAEFGQNVVVPVENQGTDLFQFALVNDVIRNDFVIGDNTLPITEGLDVSLVYATEETHAVLFLDSNGKLISNTWVDNGENVTAPATTELSKPGYKLSETPWLSNEEDTSLENITSSRVYRLQYELEETSKVNITVGETTTEYNYNDIVTLTATNPNFKAWEDEEGNVLSTKETFKFTALVDRTINESDVVPTTLPVVTMTNDLGLREGMQSFLGQLELRETDTLVEYGLVVTKDGFLRDEELTLDNGTKVKSNVLVPATNEFLLTIGEDYLVVRAFVTVRNADDSIETFYSNNQYNDPNAQPELIEATWDWTITSTDNNIKSNNSTTINGLLISWSWSGNYNTGMYVGYDGTKGQQIGSGKQPARGTITFEISLPENSIITGYSISASTASGGDTTLNHYGENNKLTASNTAYSNNELNVTSNTFTFSMTNVSAAMYFKNVTINYEYPN